MNTNKGLRVAVRQSGDAVVVRPLGRLDPLTYQQMQQTLLYCVVTKPSSLVVELDELEVTNSSSLSLFTTVWIRVGEWPGVPMVLVAGRERLRAQLNRRKLSEFVPCFPTTSEALASVNGHSPRYRERVWLPPSLNAVRWAKPWWTGSSCTSRCRHSWASCSWSSPNSCEQLPAPRVRISPCDWSSTRRC